MITIRKSDERGHASHGWLESKHTFSFADYYDPKHTHFGVLRVINEDWIDEGQGFGTHPHQDMEIITYVIEGALAHKDSMGNSTTIRPGEVQRMSAGTGVQHSEFNPSKDQKVHLLQIWLFPNKKGHQPSYGQKSFEEDLKKKNFILVASLDGREGSVSMNQETNLYLGKLKSNEEIPFETKRKHIWIQMVKGTLKVSDSVITAGDGLAATDEKKLNLVAQKDSEFLLFEME